MCESCSKDRVRLALLKVHSEPLDSTFVKCSVTHKCKFLASAFAPVKSLPGYIRSLPSQARRTPHLLPFLRNEGLTNIFITMDPPPPYEYSSIDTQSEIRIIALKPALHLSEPLEASLLTCSLFDASDPFAVAAYDAVSYRWGPSNYACVLRAVPDSTTTVGDRGHVFRLVGASFLIPDVSTSDPNVHDVSGYEEIVII